VVRDEASMPAQDRVGSDKEDRPAVAAEHASERGEDSSVDGFEARPCNLPLQNGGLMAQHEDLDILGTIPTATQDQQVDHEPDETVETGRADPDRPRPSRSDRGAKPQVNGPNEFPAPTRWRDVLTHDDLALYENAAAGLDPTLRQWLEHGRHAVNL
jgi:hypothetical protein